MSDTISKLAYVQWTGTQKKVTSLHIVDHEEENYTCCGKSIPQEVIPSDTIDGRKLCVSCRTVLARTERRLRREKINNAITN
jgi:hypothetical protein